LLFLQKKVILWAMSIENPESLSDNPGEDLFEFAEGDEYGSFSEGIRHFDEAREMTYTQAALMMQGTGGNTAYEALNKLEEMMKQTARCFSSLSMMILEDSANDTDTAVKMIANAYGMDEKERIDRLRELHDDDMSSDNDEGYGYESDDDEDDEDDEDDWDDEDSSYELMRPDIIIANINGIIASNYDTKRGFEAFYGHNCQLDINKCIRAAPDNIIETENIKKLMMRERAKNIAIEVGRMAASGLIAAILVNRFNNKK
jgi:hypothetical protein